MVTCKVCFRRCSPAEGERGDCGARINRGGIIRPVYYGQLSSLSLDPIEKKPLMHVHPGSMILSAGSLGCNLHCPFCQNYELAQAETGRFGVRTDEAGPEKLVGLAESCRSRETAAICQSLQGSGVPPAYRMSAGSILELFSAMGISS